MDRKQGKNEEGKYPKLVWGIGIAAWTLLVYILFFVNFIRDFINSRGG